MNHYNPNLRLAVPLTYMLGIFVLSSIPDTRATDTVTDKAFQWMSPTFQNLLHIPLFGGLAGCWYWALVPQISSSRLQITTTVAFTITYAFLDEIHQLYVRGRFASVTDVVLDAIGAAIAISFIKLYRPKP